MKPTLAARQSARSDSESCVMSTPATAIDPSSGLSIPAMRLRSVDLPEPDGHQAEERAASMSSVMSVRTGTTCSPRR